LWVATPSQHPPLGGLLLGHPQVAKFPQIFFDWIVKAQLAIVRE
jgi:hypothetical protein